MQNISLAYKGIAKNWRRLGSYSLARQQRSSVNVALLRLSRKLFIPIGQWTIRCCDGREVLCSVCCATGHLRPSTKTVLCWKATSRMEEHSPPFHRSMPKKLRRCEESSANHC